MSEEIKTLIIECDTDDVRNVKHFMDTWKEGRKNGLIVIPKGMVKIYEIDKLNNLKRVY